MCLGGLVRRSGHWVTGFAGLRVTWVLDFGDAVLAVGNLL